MQIKQEHHEALFLLELNTFSTNLAVANLKKNSNHYRKLLAGIFDWDI